MGISILVYPEISEETAPHRNNEYWKCQIVSIHQHGGETWLIISWFYSSKDIDGCGIE